MSQDAPQIFTSRMVRELKGAPLACLILLIMAEMPMSNEWLCMMTGYTDKPVSQALKLLSSPEYQMVVRVSKGWRIAKGLQMALPLINRNISVSATATESLSNDLINESVVVVGRNFSETLEKHKNCHFEENLSMCRRLGIGEPSASRISDSFNVLGEAIDPQFIKAHVDSRARGEGLGLAIVRILNGELPAIWQDEIDSMQIPQQVNIIEDSVI